MQLRTILEDGTPPSMLPTTVLDHFRAAAQRMDFADTRHIEDWMVNNDHEPAIYGAVNAFTAGFASSQDMTETILLHWLEAHT